MKFKSEIEKNSQNPTKKLGFYLILTLKIKRFDPLRNLQQLVNGDTDEMTLKLMHITKQIDPACFSPQITSPTQHPIPF